MPSSETRIPTVSASKYLQQLCKHWSHKYAVEFTPEKGSIPFAPDRRCDLDAEAGNLTLRIEAPDAETLARTEAVVIDHLKRFAFREDLSDVRWTQAQ
jgi:hypothetical protein